MENEEKKTKPKTMSSAARRAQRDMSVPMKLKRYRTANKMSQQQVADSMGLERSTYCKYETGITEPNLKGIVKLAKIFKVSPMDILPDTDNTKMNRRFKDAVQVDGSIEQLTNDERSLIAKYRTLSTAEKKEAMDTITKMLKK